MKHTYTSFFRYFFINIFSIVAASASCPTGVAQIPTEQIYQIITKAQYGFCGINFIRAVDVPYTITTPGLYLLAEDITVSVAAITISSDDVLLDLGSRTITHTGTGSALVVQGSNVAVYNGFINSGAASGITHASFVANNVYDNIFFRGNLDSVVGGILLLAGGSNITIRRCHFRIDSGIALAAPITGATIHDCRFTDCTSLGMVIFGATADTSREILCNNLEFTGGGAAIIFTGPFGFVQDFVLSNIVIKNTAQTLRTVNPASPNHAIQFDGATMKGVIEGISIISTGTMPEPAHGIVCNNGSSDLIIKNCSIIGTAGCGIICNNTVHNTIESCDIMYTGSTGILCFNNSGYIIIKDCIVNQILSDGISLDSTTTSCNVLGCVVNGCTDIGIAQQGDTTNKVVNNLSTNNSINFLGVSPTIIADIEATVTTANYWMNVAI